MSDHDSQELQDLFDEIVAKSPPSAQACTEPSPEGAGCIYLSIGQLVRKLHDALREIGQDSVLFKANQMLPQSRERLAFIGDLMEKSATQCVQISEREMPKLESSGASLKACKDGWDKAISGQTDPQEFKALALSTPATLQAAIDHGKSAKDSFLEILMAQGFQDLAGQSLGKVVAQVAGFERELLSLLAVAAVDHQEREKLSEFLEGPQYKKTEETVHSQQEVDDLLKDLGF